MQGYQAQPLLTMLTEIRDDFDKIAICRLSFLSPHILPAKIVGNTDRFHGIETFENANINCPITFVNLLAPDFFPLKWEKLGYERQKSVSPLAPFWFFTCIRSSEHPIICRIRATTVYLKKPHFEKIALKVFDNVYLKSKTFYDFEADPTWEIS